MPARCPAENPHLEAPKIHVWKMLSPIDLLEAIVWEKGMVPLSIFEGVIFLDLQTERLKTQENTRFLDTSGLLGSKTLPFWDLTFRVFQKQETSWEWRTLVTRVAASGFHHVSPRLSPRLWRDRVSIHYKYIYIYINMLNAVLLLIKCGLRPTLA